MATTLIPAEMLDCAECGRALSAGEVRQRHRLCIGCALGEAWDDAIREAEADVCHHGVGFDEECEDCEAEIAEEDEVIRIPPGVPHG